MNFPKFSESKGILKIGRSEVCVWGGVLRVKLLSQDFLYLNSLFRYLFRNCWRNWKEIFMICPWKIVVYWLFTFCRNAPKLLLELNWNFLQLEFPNCWTDRAAIFRICFFCTDYLLFVGLLLNRLINWTQISYSLTTEWIELIYLEYFY